MADFELAEKRYQRWMQSACVDAESKAYLNGIANDKDTVALRFGSELSFGTAGLRGEIAPGTNAINVYTIGQATQGLANYILAQGKDAAKRGVAIAYDCRTNSKELADRSAAVLTAAGIPVYLFDALRPTPLLSFTLLHLGCIAGINITASHNPKQYNGYKVYWEDGAQISGDIAKAISAQIAKTDIFDDVKSMTAEEATSAGLLTVIGKELDEAYYEQVTRQMINPDAIEKAADALHIVYTPLYGTGAKPVPEVLRRIGIKHLCCVDEQMVPDGTFPSVPFPNPEYPEAFTMGIELAEKVGSDLIVATDPDADRVGVMARGTDGKFATITGNQMGCLLLDYIITALRDKGLLGKDAYTVKSLVSTAMADKIAKENGVRMFNVYTGFKYIGSVVASEEAKSCYDFLLGFEESYGYLRGSYAKDKDAVVAAMLICEMAAYYHLKGLTLLGALDALYEKYGYYRDGVDNIYMEGLDGPERMQKLMTSLRENPPTEIGGKQIASLHDYKNGVIHDYAHGRDVPVEEEPANMLRFETVEGDAIIVRPSGTEPKIKFYYLCGGATMAEAKEKSAAFADTMKSLA